ncbi:MAG: helix-turn-helix domain-containing protein [Clostridiales bacterium]|nr:helix-turn-helix domain-containing protein [Clostridiales bacterium]
MKTIYLVDDDRLALDKLMARRALFTDSGFEICGVHTNPLKALDEIRSLRPDAVISDLKMPGLSGMGLFESLLRGAESSMPLFVIASAYSEFKDVRRLFLANGFDYLVKPVSEDELAGLLARLAKALEGPVPAGEKQTPSKRLDDILAYLREFSHMAHTTESIAKHFSLSSGSLCNLFSRNSDTTLSAYIASLRMERAADLLLKTDKPVREIAVVCGYADPLYFTRVFNKAHGMSPTRYRERGGNEQ